MTDNVLQLVARQPLIELWIRQFTRVTWLVMLINFI